MVTKRALGRLRLVRASAWLAAVTGVTGSSAALGATPDAFHREPGGFLGVGLGLLVAIGGFLAVVWSLRLDDRVAAREMASLRARGSDDQLPFGAYRRGDSVGLQASDQWLVFAAVGTLIGLVLLGVGVLDTRVGVNAGLACSLVGFAPALLFLWWGTGTPYWLTTDRLVTRGPFRREVHWTEVERFRLSHRGSSVTEIQLADAIELQVATDRPLRWGALGVTMRLGFLEVDGDELLALLEARCPNARVIR